MKKILLLSTFIFVNLNSQSDASNALKRGADMQENTILSLRRYQPNNTVDHEKYVNGLSNKHQDEYKADELNGSLLYDLPNELLFNIISRCPRAARRISREFYELATGFNKSGLRGLNNKPMDRIDRTGWAWKSNIDERRNDNINTCQNVPSFILHQTNIYLNIDKCHLKDIYRSRTTTTLPHTIDHLSINGIDYSDIDFLNSLLKQTSTINTLSIKQTSFSKLQQQNAFVQLIQDKNIKKLILNINCSDINLLLNVISPNKHGHIQNQILKKSVKLQKVFFDHSPVYFGSQPYHDFNQLITLCSKITSKICFLKDSFSQLCQTRDQIKGLAEQDFKSISLATINDFNKFITLVNHLSPKLTHLSLNANEFKNSHQLLKFIEYLGKTNVSKLKFSVSSSMSSLFWTSFSNFTQIRSDDYDLLYQAINRTKLKTVEVEEYDLFTIHNPYIEYLAEMIDNSLKS